MFAVYWHASVYVRNGVGGRAEIYLGHSFTRVFLLELEPLTVDMANTQALTGAVHLWIKISGYLVGWSSPLLV
jgi:hypothetical protein